MKTALLALLVLCVAIEANVYLQGCGVKGSNNRVTGNGETVASPIRLFDSQNSPRGGYCLHPKMHFFVGSILPIEWTTQHGCGGNPNTHCEVVLQYMCADSAEALRNGHTPAIIPDNEGTYQSKILNPDSARDPIDRDAVDNGQIHEFGMHESYAYYQECKARQRNTQLFTADLGATMGDRATSTRQNPGALRYGFECPEERDYYPYWHPSPWKDIAILTDDTSRCDYYRKNSFNNNRKNKCSINTHNNRKDCEDNGGKWRAIKSHGIDPPACLRAPWSRDNHLGNTVGSQSTGMFNWTVADDTHKFCVMRIRYNVTSGDYNGWLTDADDNGDKSPVKMRERFEYRGRNYTLNTNPSHIGRTFEDRSHVFEIRKRPTWLTSVTRVYNLNYRGKRGTVAQTFPATPYDFCPNDLHVRNGDYIHIQFSGCNTNPPNYDGAGIRGTDRTNMVQIRSRKDNVPKPRGSGDFFSKGDASELASLDQEDCQSFGILNATHLGDWNSISQDSKFCELLNAAPRYHDFGLVRVYHTEGSYHFMSTRNNQFGTSSMKMSIIVLPFLETYGVILVVMAVLMGLGAIGVTCVAVIAKVFPAGVVGQCWYRLS